MFILFNIFIAQLACEYDQMCLTIPEEIESAMPKSLFYNYYSQIKSNQMLVFDERGKLEYPGKNVPWQSGEPTTQSTFDAKCGNRTQATLVEGKCSNQ